MSSPARAGQEGARPGRSGALCAHHNRSRSRTMQVPRGDERRLSLIGGQWVPPSTEKYEPCLNPADTREVLGHFPRSGAADAKAAVDAATKAFPGWAATPGPERGRIIGRALSLLKARVDLLAEAL